MWWRVCEPPARLTDPFQKHKRVNHVGTSRDQEPEKEGGDDKRLCGRKSPEISRQEKGMTFSSGAGGP